MLLKLHGSGANYVILYNKNSSGKQAVSQMLKVREWEPVVQS